MRPVRARPRGRVGGVEDQIGRGGDQPLDRDARIRVVECAREVLGARALEHRVEEAPAPDHVERLALEHEHGAHTWLARGIGPCLAICRFDRVYARVRGRVAPDVSTQTHDRVQNVLVADVG